MNLNAKSRKNDGAQAGVRPGDPPPDLAFNPTARKEEVATELLLLRREFDAWKGRLSAGPDAAFHQTQLARLDRVLQGAIKNIENALDNIVLAHPPDAVYAELQLYDLRVVWLRRVWQYYREKFEQRADPELKDLLAAADEVVWSCYAPVFRGRPKLPLRPAPLAYVESYYSPAALPVDMVPPTLADPDVGEKFLKKMLGCLPIPVVRLPPVCARAPWWLTYLAHEVGHHVQFNLAVDRGMVTEFEALIEKVAKEHGHAADAEEWKRWSVEIFADVFSVVVIGPWAIWALLEFEFNRPDEMVRRKTYYPAPAVRLRLMEQAARSEPLRLDPSEALRGLRLDDLAAGNKIVAWDFELVPHVVKAALDTLPGLGLTLPKLCGFRRSEFEPASGKKAIVTARAESLLGSSVLIPETGLRAARLAATGALAAWSKVMRIKGDPERAARREALAARALALIKMSQEPGVRAATVDEAEQGGESLARLLLGADRQQLHS
ncbi:MAG TPA: hypothetical protein VKA15_09905 [Isosphaeraceae bacterium]|nr:hypothetical protein [Isosphaeraceae bacterium]